jgi:uncharacterized membrane protein YsdA (DUF1294 family)
MNYQPILIGILALINVIAFVIMAKDKRTSMQGGNPERTPEGILFFLAAAFGGCGIYLGMQLFRHKTKKWYFQLGIPLLIAENLATIVFVMKWFES